MKLLSCFSGITLSLILGGVAAAGSVDRVDLTDDWESDTAIASRTGVPIMIVFVTEACHYCASLKQQVLLPLLKAGVLPDKVLVREFNIDRGGKIVDFDGERVRTRIFLERYGIYATPTVMLVDYQGEPLTLPIVGYNEQVAYAEQLNETIGNAWETLVALGTPRYSASHPPLAAN